MLNATAEPIVNEPRRSIHVDISAHRQRAAGKKPTRGFFDEFAGCAVEVTHENENEFQDESHSSFDKYKTTVAVGILEAPKPLPEAKVPSIKQSPSSERPETTVKIIMPAVPDPQTEVVVPKPEPATASLENQKITVDGSHNIVVHGDLHYHKHIHVHEMPKPTPVRVEVRVEDRVSERERRRRMVLKRMSKAFPGYFQ